MEWHEILDFIEENFSDFSKDILLADGFDDAFIGGGTSFNNVPVAVYDEDKCIEILSKNMTQEEAQEYFEYNVVGSYVGKFTPIFIKRI